MYLFFVYSQYHRKMVADAAGVAGAGIGAEGFPARMGVVFGHQEGDLDDIHTGRDRRRSEEGVDEFPAAGEADRASSRTDEGIRLADERSLKGVVYPAERRVVEIAHRDDLPAQRIRQEAEGADGEGAAPLGGLGSAEFGGMMVDQIVAAGSVHAVLQRHAENAPRTERLTPVIHLPECDRKGIETALAVEQGDIDAPPVRGFAVHDPVVQLPQNRRLEQPPQDKGILHFRHADDIRHPALPAADP